MNHHTTDPLLSKLVHLLSTKVSPQPQFSSPLLSLLIEASCYVEQAARADLRKEASTQTEEEKCGSIDFYPQQKEKERKHKKKRKKERKGKKKNKREKTRTPSLSVDESDDDEAFIRGAICKCDEYAEEEEESGKRRPTKKIHKKKNSDSMNSKTKKERSRSKEKSKTKVDNIAVDILRKSTADKIETMGNEETLVTIDRIAEDTSENMVPRGKNIYVENMELTDIPVEAEEETTNQQQPLLILNRNIGLDRNIQNPLMDPIQRVEMEKLNLRDILKADKSIESEENIDQNAASIQQTYSLPISCPISVLAPSNTLIIRKIRNPGLHTRTPFRNSSESKSRTRSPSISRRSWSKSSSSSWSRSRSPSIRRRKTSPSFLDKRRITSARKLPITYLRESPCPISRSCVPSQRVKQTKKKEHMRNRSQSRKKSRGRNRSRSRSECISKPKFNDISSRRSQRSRSTSRKRSNRWSRSRTRSRSKKWSRSRTRSRSWSRSLDNK